MAQKILDVQFISSKDQLADIFTKGLGSMQFEFLCDKLYIRNGPLNLRGNMETNSQDMISKSALIKEDHHST